MPTPMFPLQTVLLSEAVELLKARAELGGL